MLFQFFSSEYEWIAYSASILASAFASITFFLFVKKNIKRKSKTLRKMEIAVLFMGFAAYIDWILFTITRPHPIQFLNYDLVTLGTQLSFTCNGISNILIVSFLADIFQSQVKKNVIFLFQLIQLIATIGILGGFLMQIPSDIRLMFLMLHVLISFVIYITLSVNSNRLRTRIKTRPDFDNVTYKGLFYIFISGILLFMAVFFFILHEVMLELLIEEYWTVAFGWIFGAIAGFSLYIGYALPEWAKKRWDKKN